MYYGQPFAISRCFAVYIAHWMFHAHYTAITIPVGGWKLPCEVKFWNSGTCSSVFFWTWFNVDQIDFNISTDNTLNCTKPRIPSSRLIRIVYVLAQTVFSCKHWYILPKSVTTVTSLMHKICLLLIPLSYKFYCLSHTIRVYGQILWVV